MKLIPRLIILLSILAAGTALDRVTKAIAKEKLSGGQTYSYLFDTLRIQYSENSGAFLSMGENLPPVAGFILLGLLPAAFLIILFIYIILSKKITAGQATAFSLILTGGMNNVVIDRFFNNRRVIDFLNMGIGPVFRTGILNFADMYVTAGFIIIVLLVYIDSRKKAPMRG